MVLTLGLLLLLLIVRNGSVAAYATSNPDRAAAIWPAHPRAIMEAGLSEVGRQAANGEEIDRSLVHRLIAAFRKAPLAPEPFLVRGVQAQAAGDEELAGRAFVAARDRDPRGLGARYFLADHDLRAGKVDEGLSEISALVRLVPQSLTSVAPYLAAFARRPDAAPKVRRMISRQPRLESALLERLATDGSNFELVLYLWSGKGGEEAKGWQSRLLNELVAAGRFQEARKGWARFTGIAAAPDQLFDRDFAIPDRPPFGWTLFSGSGGVVEVQEGGRLHVIYYGRDDLVLASQLMTLGPGRHVLSMEREANGNAAEWVSWKVRCLPSSTEIAAIPLGHAAASGTVTGRFIVPSEGCDAQWLELTARALEVPEQSELTISKLELVREAL